MKHTKKLVGLALTFSLIQLNNLALGDEQHNHADPGSYASRVDSHAPIGVMGDHTHGAGEYMASYRFMTMNMDGNLDGTRSISTQDVLDDYMVSPLDMTMDMHMLGLMYAPTDDITLLAMLPYIETSMDHRTRMGREFTTETSGLGDAKLAALVNLWANDHHKVHLNAGLSLPTGGIDEEDDTPAGRSRLPYPMQLGSGTYDLMPGLTYTAFQSRGSWGAQALGTFRLDENDNDYTLGDKLDLSAWASAVVCKGFSTSIRLAHSDWSNVSGADASLNPNMVPTADPGLRGGSRTDLGLGVNLLSTGGVTKGHRLAAEVLLPIRQDLNGPQLETDLSFVIGWQKAW